jgi:Family of unknown function (DUF6247)
MPGYGSALTFEPTGSYLTQAQGAPDCKAMQAVIHPIRGTTEIGKFTTRSGVAPGVSLDWPSNPRMKPASVGGCVSFRLMSHLPSGRQQPVVPLPEREPAAIRAAVARLDPAALARFEADWTAATSRARDEYSLLPARYFVEHWFAWVAVHRWPQLADRLRACERIVAESADRFQRRGAAAEISQILRQAEAATG